MNLFIHYDFYYQKAILKLTPPITITKQIILIENYKYIKYIAQMFKKKFLVNIKLKLY